MLWTADTVATDNEAIAATADLGHVLTLVIQLNDFDCYWLLARHCSFEDRAKTSSPQLFPKHIVLRKVCTKSHRQR